MSLATSDVSTDQFVYRTLVGTITAAIFTTGYHDELKETLVIWVPGGELMQSHYFLIFFFNEQKLLLKNLFAIPEHISSDSPRIFSARGDNDVRHLKVKPL